MDFAHLQVWAEQVLQRDDIAAAVGGSPGYLMVDEYQDVSRVQMRILQRMAGAHSDVAVVGDDDQSMYLPVWGLCIPKPQSRFYVTAVESSGCSPVSEQKTLERNK